MASRIKNLGVASLIALAAVAGLIVFSPKNQPSEHSASAPPARPEETQPTVVEDQALDHARQEIANAMQDPSKVRLMECIGVNPWEVKPAGWTAPTEEECAVLEQKLGATADARTATALPGAPSEEVALLIAEEEKFNDKCRGGSGDDSETQKACDERDLLYEKIKAKNWCWGHDGQIGADRTWEPCHLENSVRQANPWTQATPQGQTTATAVSQQPEPSPPKQDIRTVHGADGLDYVFDMNHAVRSQNGTSIPLYIGPPPVVPQKGKESFVGFNCQGGFVMLDNTGAPTSAWGVTRPNSVMGLISKMICATRDIRTIEADNGTVYTFDMSLVHPGAGGIEVMVHDSSQENWEFTGMEFDCAGHFMIEEGNELSEWMYAAPNSVAGKIEEIVCRKPGP